MSLLCEHDQISYTNHDEFMMFSSSPTLFPGIEAFFESSTMTTTTISSSLTTSMILNETSRDERVNQIRDLYKDDMILNPLENNGFRCQTCLKHKMDKKRVRLNRCHTCHHLIWCHLIDDNHVCPVDQFGVTQHCPNHLDCPTDFNSRHRSDMKKAENELKRKAQSPIEGEEAEERGEEEEGGGEVEVITKEPKKKKKRKNENHHNDDYPNRFIDVNTFHTHEEIDKELVLIASYVKQLKARKKKLTKTVR